MILRYDLSLDDRFKPEKEGVAPPEEGLCKKTERRNT